MSLGTNLFSPSLSSIFCCLSLRSGSKMRAETQDLLSSQLYIHQARAYTSMPAFPAKGISSHWLFWGRCPPLNLSLCQEGIRCSDWVRVWVLWSTYGLGVELFPKPIGWEWWRMWFSEGKSGYNSQKNGEPAEAITSHRWLWPALLLSRAYVQADYLVIIRLCGVYDSRLVIFVVDKS